MAWVTKKINTKLFGFCDVCYNDVITEPKYFIFQC